MHVIEDPKNRSLSKIAAAAKSLQSCPTLCNPIDGSPPGSSWGFYFSLYNTKSIVRKLLALVYQLEDVEIWVSKVLLLFPLWCKMVSTLQALYVLYKEEELRKGTMPAAAAKSLQLCPTLCDPIDGSPPGSPVPEILQARILEWVAISFSNAWKWKVKVKSLSRVRLPATPWTAAYQAPLSMGFSRREYWSGVPLPSPMPAEFVPFLKKLLGKSHTKPCVCTCWLAPYHMTTSICKGG